MNIHIVKSSSWTQYFTCITYCEDMPNICRSSAYGLFASSFRFKSSVLWIIPILSGCMALSLDSLSIMGSALSQVGPTFHVNDSLVYYTFTSEFLSRICREWLCLWLPSYEAPTTHPGTEFSMGKAGGTRYI